MMIQEDPAAPFRLRHADRLANGLEHLASGIYGAPVSGLTVMPGLVPGEPKTAA